MISRATRRFWTNFQSLPADIQAKARQAHRLWLENPRHPSLQFKKVNNRFNVYSARVDVQWRALCTEADGAFIWFWIGSHDDYEKLLVQF